MFACENAIAMVSVYVLASILVNLCASGTIFLLFFLCVWLILTSLLMCVVVLVQFLWPFWTYSNFKNFSNIFWIWFTFFCHHIGCSRAPHSCAYRQLWTDSTWGMRLFFLNFSCDCAFACACVCVCVCACMSARVCVHTCVWVCLFVWLCYMCAFVCAYSCVLRVCSHVRAYMYCVPLFSTYC